MNGKTIAIMAVLALVFAGFGTVFTDGSDAADAGAGDLILIVDDAYIADEDTLAVIAAIYGAEGGVYYTTTLDDDFEEKITVLTKDYYDAMKNAGLIKGMTVTFQTADLENDDIVMGLEIFTAVEMNRLGDIIGGVNTKIVIDNDVLTKDLTYEVVDADTAAAELIIAVAAAVAEVEEQYADYLSPEEATEAVDKAVQIVKDSYKDYKSPAEVQKMIDDAVAEATKNIENSNVWMYAFVVAVIVLAGLVAFGMWTYFKDKKAVKAQEPAE